MIKIELNEKTFRNGKTSITGEVEVKGSEDVLTHEIYAILKEFEANVPEPYINALDLVMKEFFRKMEGEDDK